MTPDALREEFKKAVAMGMPVTMEDFDQAVKHAATDPRITFSEEDDSFAYQISYRPHPAFGRALVLADLKIPLHAHLIAGKQLSDDEADLLRLAVFMKKEGALLYLAQNLHKESVPSVDSLAEELAREDNAGQPDSRLAILYRALKKGNFYYFSNLKCAMLKEMQAAYHHYAFDAETGNLHFNENINNGTLRITVSFNRRAVYESLGNPFVRIPFDDYDRETLEKFYKAATLLAGAPPRPLPEVRQTGLRLKNPGS